MPKETYFVIHTHEDGISCYQYTIEELMTFLAEIGDDVENIVNKIPNESDMTYWGTRIVIIKGEVVVPRKKEVVVKYEI